MAATCTDWDWWRSAEGSRSPVEKEWDSIPAWAQGEFKRLMERWEQGDLQPVGGDCARMGEWGVLYLRVRRSSNPFRLYFQIRGTVAVVLHVTYKNQQKIDKATSKLLKKRANSGSPSS